MKHAFRSPSSFAASSEIVVDTTAGKVESIEVAVRAALDRCGRYAIAKLDCDCFLSTNGLVMVTLKGHLPSFHLSQIAQEIVRHVPGVHLVRNQIQVDYLP